MRLNVCCWLYSVYFTAALLSEHSSSRIADFTSVCREKLLQNVHTAAKSISVYASVCACKNGLFFRWTSTKLKPPKVEIGYHKTLHRNRQNRIRSMWNAVVQNPLYCCCYDIPLKQKNIATVGNEIDSQRADTNKFQVCGSSRNGE